MPFSHSFCLSTICLTVFLFSSLEPSLSRNKHPAHSEIYPMNGSFNVADFAVWLGIYRYMWTMISIQL